MSWPVGGMQAFMRAANLFGPDAMDQSYQQPDETLHAQVGPPMEELHAQVGGPQMPPLSPTPMSQRPMNMPTSIPEQMPDEYLTAQTEQPDALESFRQSVMNPPQREHMTYPKSTLSGLHKALEVAAEKTPYEQNRVFINGNPYQQVKVVTDAQGNKQYVNKYKQPGFGEQVMKAMPASVEAGVDLANQPYEDALADWKLKNEGLGKLATAESNMALAGLRGAQAGAVPVTARARMMQAEAALSRADTAGRLAALKDLTDSERLDLLNRQKISQDEYNNAARMDRVNAQQTGATTRAGMAGQTARDVQGMRGTQAKELEELRGRNRAAQIDQQGRIRSGQITQQGGIRSQQITQTAEEARKTKAAPSGASGATGNIPSQRKIAEQDRAMQIVNDNPELDGMIIINDNGYPMIDPELDKETYDKVYEALYPGAKRGAATNPASANPAAAGSPAGPATNPMQPALPPPAAAQTITNPAAPMTPVKSPEVANAPVITTPTGQKITVPPPKSPGVQPIIQSNADGSKFRISYDGGKTYQPYNPFGK